MATTLAILQAIAALAGLLGQLFKLKQSSDDRQAGADEAVRKGQEETDALVNKAQKGREAVRDTLARDPDSIMRDDGFQRKE